MLNEMDGWMGVENHTVHFFLLSCSLLYSIFLLALRQDENEIDVWLAIKREEFKQNLINISSPSIRSDRHWG